VEGKKSRGIQKGEEHLKVFQERRGEFPEGTRRGEGGLKKSCSPLRKKKHSNVRQRENMYCPREKGGGEKRTAVGGTEGGIVQKRGNQKKRLVFFGKRRRTIPAKKRRGVLGREG